MMERLREGVNSIAVKIILGLVILSFVFAGVGSYIVGGTTVVAKVNGAEIDRTAFEQAYTNERNRMQAQMGDYFSNLLANSDYVQTFRKSVIDRMINELLIEQYADSLGMRVSNSQVRQQILDIPDFQNNGKFDQEIYASTLRRVGFNADSFAEYIRRDMTRQQVLSALQESEFSLEGEVMAQNLLLSQTRDIRSIAINVEDIAKGIELTDEESQEYYHTNSANYTRPEQVKVSYIELSAQALKALTNVSDAQVKEYYHEHLDKYSSAESRELSHILVQGDDKAKIQAILDELNEGKDFAELAQMKSEDIGSSEQGGSLGWVEKGLMDPTFEAAAFALQNVGETTGIVESSFGYHIIKLDGVNDRQVKPFEEVAAEIKAELVDQKAIELFYEQQTILETVAFEFPDSLDEAAQAIKQSVQETNFISRLDAPQLLQDPAIMQAIFSSEVKEDGLNSEVIEVAPEHVIVVRVEDWRSETVLPFEQVKEQVNTELAWVKGEQKAQDIAESILEALRSGDESVVSKNGLAFSEMETIERSSPLAETAFAMVKPDLAERKKTYDKTTDLAGNIVIVELNKVSAEVDSSSETLIEAQLVRAGTQQDIASVINTLREGADIKYYVLDTQP